MPLFVPSALPYLACPMCVTTLIKLFNFSSGTEEITINPNSQWVPVPVKLDIKEEGKYRSSRYVNEPKYFTAVSSDARPPNAKCSTAIVVFDI